MFLFVGGSRIHPFADSFPRYTFGRVENLPGSKSRDYNCFSAGCMVITSVFLGRTYDSVAVEALEVQSRWKSGEIGMYEVAGEFVDSLLDLKSDPSNALISDDWLPQVRVLTSTRYGAPQMAAASNRGELRTLLLKTSFIPFATGLGMTRDGENDGGFSFLFHPRCAHTVMLPATWRMLSNVLNVNMGMETVRELYEVGKEEEAAKERRRVEREEVE